MKNQRVALVTGATGFVGSHLVRRLVQDGWEVHTISRPSSHAPDIPEFGHVINHVHDGSTEGMVACLAIAKPDVVFHLASLFISQHASKDVEPLILSNVLFGGQLLEAMRVNEVRHLVNTGTSWQHYEDQPYDPVNLYAATKQAFEALVRYYVESDHFRVITLKLFDTYGEDDPRPKLMNLLKEVITTNQSLAMSPGEQRIDLVHVEDVVNAFMQAASRLLECDEAACECYAVTSGHAIQLRELVGLIEQRLERKLPIVWGGLPYRKREVMEPWQGEPLPGWTPLAGVEQAIDILCS